jgi:nucleotide-binding universal stress UspA family protein
MAEFPGWTETDLYLWVSGYRVFLEEDLGWQLASEGQSEPLPGTVSGFQGSVAQVINGIADRLFSSEGERSLLPGEWRREHLLNLFKTQSGRPFRLFTTILVPVDGREQGWFALNQALGVARREGGRLLGLHIAPAKADETSPAVQQIKAEFNGRCAQAGIPGQLAVETGSVADKISDRARWADLVVIRLVYPPAARPIARLGSGLRTIIRQARCPLLFVPRDFVYPLDRALLAYDGSPKAQEALYVATYLASRWQVSLVVVTVLNGRVTETTIKTVQDYLQLHQVEATILKKTGPVVEAILAVAEENNSNLIIMGGYGYNPVMELVLGSAVDEVLRTSRRPTLICG